MHVLSLSLDLVFLLSRSERGRQRWSWWVQTSEGKLLIFRTMGTKQGPRTGIRRTRGIFISSSYQMVYFYLLHLQWNFLWCCQEETSSHSQIKVLVLAQTSWATSKEIQGLYSHHADGILLLSTVVCSLTTERGWKGSYDYSVVRFLWCKYSDPGSFKATDWSLPTAELGGDV